MNKNAVKDKYLFSVVMAVYNVENYLREAVESLICQTIGFSRIQLILVDDGSTDKSSAVCDEYRKKYPENVVVIHKENGRQASARNEGLKYVQGKFVNFMDPDDTLEKTAMEKVFSFMKDHEGETDICTIPIFFFGNGSGPHFLNDKFENGDRVIDLFEEENAGCILLSSSASFYTEKAAQRIVFDQELFTAEDAKVTLGLLMDRPRIGVVTGTRYNYRKSGGSTLDRSRRERKNYLTYLRNFSNWALDEAEKKFGYIPSFVQFTVMYDLQWKVKQENIPAGVLSEEEEARYKKELIDTICRIDDRIILRQKYLGNDYKAYLLSRKHAWLPDPKTTETVWEFLTIDPQTETCTAEGHCLIFGIDLNRVQPCLIVNREEVLCEKYRRKEMDRISLGENVSYAIGFRAVFPLDKRGTVIRPALKIDGKRSVLTDFSFRSFFPVSDVYENAFAYLQGHIVTLNGNSLRISGKRNRISCFVRECRFMKEIWDKNLLGGRKAVGGRLYYHLARPFKRKKLWIISDRVNKADDSGEALFRYLQDHKPKNTNVIFAVRKDSDDYSRMSRTGKCVSAMSFRHKLLYLLSDINISSHAEAASMFYGYGDAVRDLTQHQQSVFLQHGVIKDDLSGWLNRFNKNFSGFVTSSRREWESVAKGNYYYPEKAVWLTGLPRYDRLTRNKKRKIVTLMPTWRESLMENNDVKTGQWTPVKEFKEKAYYRFYNTLLNSEKLLETLESKGYTLQFLPHPVMWPHMKMFQRDHRVRFIPGDISYREVFAESSLVVTDYSSAVFDFAYLRKPVIYCQFDKDDIFSGTHLYEKGYFDYERDGFGEVAYDVESTIELITEYVCNGCRLKEEYRNRIDRFFAFNDRNNCRRVFEKILEIQEKS